MNLSTKCYFNSLRMRIKEKENKRSHAKVNDKKGLGHVKLLIACVHFAIIRQGNLHAMNQYIEVTLFNLFHFSQ